MKRFNYLFILISIFSLITTSLALGFSKSSHYNLGPTYSFIPEPDNEAYLISFSNGFAIDTRNAEPKIPMELKIDEPFTGSIYYILQFTGPIRQEWFKDLKRHGITTIGYLPHYAVLAKMNQKEKAVAAGLPMVRWIGIFQPAYKLQDVLLYATGTKEIVILLTPGEELAPVIDQINLNGGTIEEVLATDFGKTVKAKIDGNMIPNLARLQEVLWIQEWTQAELCNDNDQWVVQTGWRSVAPSQTDTISRKVWTRGVRGQGIILSTTDTGLRHTHNLFRDPGITITPPGIYPTHRKVVAFKTYQGASTTESPFHGTHVNGTVAGDDSITGGTSFYDGMSIKGRLYFVDISNATGSLITPTDLTAMYDTVHLGRGLGYHILQHSGSWGWGNTTGTYLIQDASTDAYCWRNKDFLNIYAAANSGGPNRRVANPGLSKDVITVGGTQNGTLSNAIYTNSSRGPAQDNRIKPTICAPAVLLWSSSNTGDAVYTQLTGTSMATPGVNGAVGLIRCYLQKGYYPTGESVPANQLSYISSALLKAMAITSADPNVGSYVVPDSNIGWGRIDVDSVLYFAGDLRKLLIKDDTFGIATGLYKEDTFTVNSSIPLKICVAWTDTAAAPSANPTLVNDVNLEVYAPGGTYYRGNKYSAGQSQANPTTWDNRNVEECVRVNSPVTGLWRIRIYGQNVVTTRQPFAYCVSGDIALAPPTALDVGVKAIIAPTGTIDSSTVITPQARIKNFGTSLATFPVTFRIGGFYNNTQTVTNLAAGDSVIVNFLAWTAIQRGTWTTRCTTALVGDQNSNNDTLNGSVLVRVRDVGVTQIVAPTGIVDSTAQILPQVRVRNYGSNTETFNVTFRILGTAYNQTQSKTLNPGIEDTVNLPAWVPMRGTFSTRCSTYLANDVNHNNDTLSGSVTIRVQDVGVIQIIAPTGIVDSGTVLTPQARVRNFGTTVTSFPVTFKIGTLYTSTQNVTNLNPGDSSVVNFAAWTALPRGTLTTKCSTAFSSDANPVNNSQTGSVTVRVKDVGVTQIVTPSGIIDSTGQIIPQVRISNYGTNSETFDVNLRIGASYTQTRSKTIGSGLEDTVSFLVWTTIRGTYITRCSTNLIGDACHTNDTLSGSVTVQVRDVGVTQIVSPSGIIDSTVPIIPQARVRNYGSNIETFNVTFGIGTIYTQTRSKTLNPGIEDTVNFPSWVPMRGVYVTRCSSYLSGDFNPNNDTLSGSVTIQVHDVGVTQIVSPSGIIDSTGQIIPQVSIRNNGTNNETFNVTLSIGIGYIQTRAKTLSPGIEDTVNFPAWTTIRGSYPTHCSTYLANDVNSLNDTLSGSVLVQVKDIGVTQIVIPTGTIDSTGSINPQVRVRNYGTNPETFDAVFTIGTIYSQTRTKTLSAGIEDTINFPSWITIRGTFTTRCSTYLSGDVNGSNDTISGSVTIQVRDVGADEILVPTGNISPGSIITPSTSIANFGTSPEVFSVYFRIISASDTIYSDDTTITIASANDTVIDFNQWNAISGTYQAYVRTSLTGDLNPVNDTISNNFTVSIGVTAWQRMADILSTPSTKYPKSGSCIAGLNGKVYFLKASNTQDFAIYTPPLGSGSGAWTNGETIPIGTKAAGDGKKPKKGAALAGYENAVYALRGNNTPGFWKYVIDSSWVKLANILTGAKNPKDASGLAAVIKNGTPYIFAMKGSKTDEFYLYDIGGKTWVSTATRPGSGTSGKVGYKKGSCLTWDGDSFVYVLKGNYGDLFKFNLYTDVWTELKRYDAKVFINRDGKKKKPKDGAGLVYYANNLYMLKGGNTLEFWMYDIAANNWIQMSPGNLWDIPTGTGKKVKGGGSLTLLGSNFYATKGANTPEFYMHTVPMIVSASVPSPNEGIMSDELLTKKFELTIKPNPATNVTTISYNQLTPGPMTIKLYNITGTLVKSYYNSAPSRAGVLTIDTRILTSGVYILRFDSEETKVTRKLVIEK